MQALAIKSMLIRQSIFFLLFFLLLSYQGEQFWTPPGSFNSVYFIHFEMIINLMYFRSWICSTLTDTQRRHYIMFHPVNFAAPASNCLKSPWTENSWYNIFLHRKRNNQLHWSVWFKYRISCNSPASKCLWLMNAAIISSPSHYWSPGIRYFALRAW